MSQRGAVARPPTNERMNAMTTLKDLVERVKDSDVISITPILGGTVDLKDGELTITLARIPEDVDALAKALSLKVEADYPVLHSFKCYALLTDGDSRLIATVQCLFDVSGEERHWGHLWAVVARDMDEYRRLLDEKKRALWHAAMRQGFECVYDLIRRSPLNRRDTARVLLDAVDLLEPLDGKETA